MQWAVSGCMWVRGGKGEIVLSQPRAKLPLLFFTSVLRIMRETVGQQRLLEA